MSALKTGKRDEAPRSHLRYLLFGLSICFSLFCVYQLFNLQNGSTGNLSGELIIGRVDTSFNGYGNAPVTAFFFEYAGLMSYALALLPGVIGYFVFFRRFNIYRVDFFALSLRVLGFNLALLGMSSLLSFFMFLETTGAGGLLGDMMNIALINVMPRVAALALFIAVSYTGLMFLVGISPWLLFELVGSVFGGRKKEEQNVEEPVAVTENSTDSSFLRDGPALNEIDTEETAVYDREAAVQEREMYDSRYNPETFSGTENVGNTAPVFTAGSAKDSGPAFMAAPADKTYAAAKTAVEEAPFTAVPSAQSRDFADIYAQESDDSSGRYVPEAVPETQGFKDIHAADMYNKEAESSQNTDAADGFFAMAQGQQSLNLGPALENTPNLAGDGTGPYGAQPLFAGRIPEPADPKYNFADVNYGASLSDSEPASVSDVPGSERLAAAESKALQEEEENTVSTVISYGSGLADRSVSGDPPSAANTMVIHNDNPPVSTGEKYVPLRDRKPEPEMCLPDSLNLSDLAVSDSELSNMSIADMLHTAGIEKSAQQDRVSSADTGSITSETTGKEFITAVPEYMTETVMSQQSTAAERAESKQDSVKSEDTHMSSAYMRKQESTVADHENNTASGTINSAENTAPTDMNGKDTSESTEMSFAATPTDSTADRQAALKETPADADVAVGAAADPIASENGTNDSESDENTGKEEGAVHTIIQKVDPAVFAEQQRKRREELERKAEEERRKAEEAAAVEAERRKAEEEERRKAEEAAAEEKAKKLAAEKAQKEAAEKEEAEKKNAEQDTGPVYAGTYFAEKLQKQKSGTSSVAVSPEKEPEEKEEHVVSTVVIRSSSPQIVKSSDDHSLSAAEIPAAMAAAAAAKAEEERRKKEEEEKAELERIEAARREEERIKREREEAARLEQERIAAAAAVEAETVSDKAESSEKAEEDNEPHTFITRTPPSVAAQPAPVVSAETAERVEVTMSDGSDDESFGRGAYEFGGSDDEFVGGNSRRVESRHENRSFTAASEFSFTEVEADDKAADTFSKADFSSSDECADSENAKTDPAENIISFTGFAEDSASRSYEIGSLSSAFIPADIGNGGEDDEPVIKNGQNFTGRNAASGSFVSADQSKERPKSPSAGNFADDAEGAVAAALDAIESAAANKVVTDRISFEDSDEESSTTAYTSSFDFTKSSDEYSDEAEESYAGRVESESSYMHSDNSYSYEEDTDESDESEQEERVKAPYEGLPVTPVYKDQAVPAYEGSAFSDGASQVRTQSASPYLMPQPPVVPRAGAVSPVNAMQQMYSGMGMMPQQNVQYVQMPDGQYVPVSMQQNLLYQQQMQQAALAQQYAMAQAMQAAYMQQQTADNADDSYGDDDYADDYGEDEDTYESEREDNAEESSVTSDSAAYASASVPAPADSGMRGNGFASAGNNFGGAVNSSASKLPSYMAGVSVAPVRMPGSLSLCSVPKKKYDDWRPDPGLLKLSHDRVEVTEEELERTAERINSVLRSYGVKAVVADYLTGPVITRFDLDLEPGVKSTAVSSIEKELCRNLMVPNVRVLPIIEGSPYVGLEVPNARRQFITLGDMIDCREFRESKAALPMLLGASVVGTPVVKDLAESPHLLVAGTTGSGKSAGLNTMLISLLLKRSPAELRLILVDPKQLEFSIYKDLPHLITPVITDVADKTPIALNWCIEEMERRFRLMSMLGVRKLSEYNDLIKSESAQGRSVPDPLWNPETGGPTPQALEPLPCIVVVVEEFADLMAQSSRKKDKDNSPEGFIKRLTAKSRAAGIHLVLVTQTPRADVVNGMIKANIPSRIAFTVQNRLDSTIVLDDKGAECLLGNGDMLYKFFGSNNLSRAHGAFTSNDDVKAVVNAWKSHGGAPEYLEDVVAVPEAEEPEGDSSSGLREQKPDAKLDAAAELVREYLARKNKLPSITDLQNDLGVGFPRAKRIFKQLIQAGVIEE